jgi:phosphate transport system protein
MSIPRLQALREKLVAYARLVEEMILRCRAALLEGQAGMAAVVMEEDEPHANAREVELEEECTSVIARHQPMARELRTVLMIMRITGDLERIADHAVNIAESAGELADAGRGIEGLPLAPELARMFDAALAMLGCAIRAFVDADAALGQRVCGSDGEVDRLAVDVLEKASAGMAGRAAGVAGGLAALRVAANLERIADLATNIGEGVIYMEVGRVIKHHHEEVP